MSLTSDLLRRIDSAPQVFRGRDLQGSGSKSGYGSAIDRMIAKKILARTPQKGYYKRLVPSAFQAYAKSLDRKSRALGDNGPEQNRVGPRNAVAKPVEQLTRRGRPQGENTNTRQLLQSMQGLGESFTFGQVREVEPDMPQGSVTYVLKKAVQHGLVRRTGLGDYIKLVPDLVAAYYDEKRYSARPLVTHQAQEERSGGILRTGKNTLLIVVDERAFLVSKDQEVAFVKRGKGTV